jgi:TetR/AcrR family transcriptional regulator of autoinduction and epiphytic fitness
MAKLKSRVRAEVASEASPDIQPHQLRISRSKRKLILDASIHTFLASGYRAARMDAIGDLAGVSYATLYKHFPSKEELFIAVVDHMVERLLIEYREHAVPDDLEPGLRAICRNFCDVVSDPQLIATTRMIIGQVHIFPEIGKRFYAARKPFADRTDRWMRERVDEGLLAIADVERARAELIGMLNDVFYFPRLFILDYTVSQAKATRTVDSVVETFLARYRA